MSRNGSRWAIAFLLALLAASAIASPVAAEHESNHRYAIVGEVRDARGPVCGLLVRAADITQPSPDADRTAFTARHGRYGISLHLHSELVMEDHNEGDTIRVTVEATGDARDVRAVRNGDNASAWGQQTVEFALPGTVPSPVPCVGEVPPPPPWSIGAVAGVLLAASVAVLAVLVILRRSRG